MAKAGERRKVWDGERNEVDVTLRIYSSKRAGRELSLAGCGGETVVDGCGRKTRDGLRVAVKYDYCKNPLGKSDCPHTLRNFTLSCTPNLANVSMYSP